MRTETTAQPAALPTRCDLHRALCGNNIGVAICAAAHALVALHRQPLPGPDQDRARAAWIAEIDLLVATHAPHPRATAPIHTETVGAIVDRMASTAAQFLDQLDDLGAADLTVSSTWRRLAQLELGYSDLATEILAGRKRLPHTDIHP